MDNGSGGYFVHLKPFGNGDNGDVGNESGVSEVICGDRSYSYEFAQFDGWNRYILKVKNV